MELITSEPNVTDEVKILHTPGHTPGSVSVLLELGRRVRHFHWRRCAPVHPTQRVRVVTSWRSGSRNVAFSSPRVVEEAVGRNAVMAAPHLDEGPVFGRMVMLNGRRIWQGIDVVAQRETS